MSSQRRYTLLLAVLLIVIVGVFGATIITLQSMSHSPNPLPTLAQIADTEPEAEPVVHADSTNPMMDIVPPDVESAAPVTDDEPLSTISNPIDVPAEPVTDQYILELSDDINRETLADIAAELDIEIVETIDELNRVVVLADETSITQLTAESVVSSEPDYYASALMNVPPTDPLYGVQWSLDMIGAPAAWANLPDDIPTIRVAVLDTGICEDHPDMQGAYSTFRWDYVEKDNTPQDEFGHGCSVAGVIASQNNDMGLIGVAPFVEIMPLRVLGADGVGKYSDIAQAVIDATNHGAQIINLSLGGYNKSSTLQSAVNYALTNDVYVVAATGNDGKSQPLYPAAFDGVIAVGSVNESGTVSTFSNGGEDTLAPGEMIAVPYLSNTYVYQSGTSFAAPHVSGVIALELALGSIPAFDGGIIHVDVSDMPLASPTPDVTATPEFITVNGRTIPNLGQLDEPEKTDRWSVRLSDNVDANAIASGLGFRNLGQVGELKNYYVFVRDGSGTSEALALSATQALAESADILEFAQEVRRKPVLNALPSDPLVNYQWHLKNTGQSGGTPGNDINVEGAWDAGYTGNNTTIAAVDDGLDITHPDFVTKYNAASSYDFNGSDTTSELDSDSNPSHEVNDIGHGTSVLGVAAADDDGSTCGVGVAYDADVASIRLLGDGHDIVDSQVASALNYEMQINDIYNNSWGYPSFPPSPLEPLTAAAIINGIQNGRGGKGSIFVWSAGNYAEISDHANADTLANSRYTIAVGATGHDGIRVPYSEMGTNLLVNAPSKIASIFDVNLSEGGIVTSDRQGTAGHNNTSGFSDDCTDSFDGTSASAPMVSGVVALMLDANPNLTWRDVQHILVESARKNDPTDSLWNTNYAGHEFNIQYGFGTVDAAAAVALAETWTNVDPEVSYDSGDIDMLNTLIEDGTTTYNSGPPNLANGLHSSIYVPDNIKVESIEIDFDAYHTWQGDLVMYLTSPRGTTSYVYPYRVNDNNNGDIQLTISSMEFWGEPSNGVWTFSVYDAYRYDEGSMRDWRLRIHGTQDVAPDGKYYVGHPHGLYEAWQVINASGATSATIELNPNAEYLSDGANKWWYDELISVDDIDLTINGNFATIRRQASEEYQFLVVGADATVTLNDITIQNFRDAASSANDGGAIHNKGTLNINNSYIQGSADKGGGIYNLGTLTIRDSQLSGFADTGGALYLQSGTADIQDTTFLNSQADNAGALYNNIPLTMLNVTFLNNKADYDGGAIKNYNTLSIISGTFEENTAHPLFGSDGGYGGAIYNNGGDLDLVDTQFINNLANRRGGALMTDLRGTLDITNSIFEGNQVDSPSAQDSGGDDTGGGALYLQGSGGGSLHLVEISGTTFIDNTAINGYGGAIFLDNYAYLDMFDTEFSDNRADVDGGAIHSIGGFLEAFRTILDSNTAGQNGGAMAIKQTTYNMTTKFWQSMISNNVAEAGHGGAIYALFGRVILISNATITGNRAYGHGGAAYFRNYGHLLIDASTITNNTADSSNTGNYDGGGFYNYYEPDYTNYEIRLRNSILFNNIDGSPSPNNNPDCVSRVYTYGDNIVGDITDCNLAGVGNNLVGVDPQLEPLQFNGGFSQSFAIPVTSPAFNAVTSCVNNNGLPLLDDMRGISRPQGAACDIGAFELTLDFPADPTNLITTTIDANSVQLDWTDNSSDETEFVIERSPVGQNSWTELGRVFADTTTFTDNSLVCDDNFDYRVWAYRLGDNKLSENPTATVTGSSALCPPDTPTNVTVDTVLYSENLEINWQDVNDDESEFRIMRNISGILTEIGTTNADVTTYTDTDAKDCYTEYFYQIQVYRAIDGQTSELSDIASGQTSCSEVYAPVSLTSAVNETTIDLTWNDNSPDETSFEIQRRVSGTVSWTFTDTVGTDITTYTDTTTACGGEYDYQVRAYREGDGKYSTADMVNIRQTCPPPPAPSDLTLTALPFTNDIQLDWVDNSTTETHFYIERSPDGADWDEITTVGEDVTTYTDTDASLECYKPYYYRVQGYRSDDGVSSDYTATVSIWTWCDADTELPVYAPPSSVTVTPGDISQVIGFPQPSCVDYIDYAYVWEAPEIAPDYVTYTTFGSTMDTVLSFWKYDGNSYVEVGCNDDVKADGTSSLSVSFPGGSDAYFTIVGGKNGANGSITLNSGVVPTPTWTPVPTETPIPTATDLPDLSTVGLYKEGLWYFRDSNQTGNADFIIRFGINTNQDWQPLVGDWNADGIDGFGLYRNGRWVLRDVIEDGSSIDYQFNFGPTEDGWQPVVGDWDGRGDDSIGLYKDGVWLLRNGLSHGDPDYQFRFNPSGQSDAIAVAGDWHDESRDRVGLYVNGRWYLSYDNQTRSGALVFNFGPSDGSWLPIVGDWDEDGDDTVGLFKDGGWRFRNSNSRGNPDFGMTFGLQGGIPIAGYRGDGEALALFASVSDLVVSEDPTATILPSMTPTLIVIATDEPAVDVTVTLTPTETAVETATALPTDTATWTPTWTQSPTATATATPTATMTPSPTATEEPLEIPENTSGT